MKSGQTNIHTLIAILRGRSNCSSPLVKDRCVFQSWNRSQSHGLSDHWVDSFDRIGSMSDSYLDQVFLVVLTSAHLRQYRWIAHFTALAYTAEMLFLTAVYSSICCKCFAVWYDFHDLQRPGYICGIITSLETVNVECFGTSYINAVVSCSYRVSFVGN